MLQKVIQLCVVLLPLLKNLTLSKFMFLTLVIKSNLLSVMNSMKTQIMNHGVLEIWLLLLELTKVLDLFLKILLTALLFILVATTKVNLSQFVMIFLI